MAQRYCTNCGAELGEEARFCPNCGRPVHETASVPTPEADVPVPPPLQVGGTGTTASEQQAGWGRRHPILTGCLGLVALFFLIGIVGAALGGGGDETAGAGGGRGGESPAEDRNKAAEETPEKKEQPQVQKQEEEPEPKPKPKSKPEYSVGQTANVANVTWTVSDAFLTNRLRSSFGTQKRGRFVVIDFTFTNNRSEEG